MDTYDGELKQWIYVFSAAVVVILNGTTRAVQRK
jgi:hypothetical protein